MELLVILQSRAIILILKELFLTTAIHPKQVTVVYSVLEFTNVYVYFPQSVLLYGVSCSILGINKLCGCMLFLLSTMSTIHLQPKCLSFCILPDLLLKEPFVLTCKQVRPICKYAATVITYS